MEALYDLFTNTVASLYQSVQKIKALEMEEFGLKTGHVDCLHILNKHPDGLTHKALMEQCEMDKAAVSRYVAALRERGFIEDLDNDLRKYNRRIRLTASGKQVADETNGKIVRAVQNGSADMSDAERELFYLRMKQIADNLRRYLAEMEESR